MWWKISLIALFLIFVIWFMFSIYACIKVGSKSDSIDYLAEVNEEDNSNDQSKTD